MKKIALMLRELNISNNRRDRLFYLACLKEIGKMGKQLYKLRQEIWLKNFLIWLYNYIQTYEITKPKKIIQ